VLISPKKHILSYLFPQIQLCFNNIAKYQALILGLQMKTEMGIKDFNVHDDSQLVMNGLLEEFRVRKVVMPHHKHAL